MIKHLLALACLAVTPAFAQVEDIVTAELLPGWREDGRHIAAIRLTLAPGWKTYWRAPGDAGIPPVFDWSASGNVRAVAVQYPVPKVFDQGGVRSVGYADSVTFPVFITPQEPGGAI